ncbi:IS3 family transposase, partial [Leucothrix arctica]
MAVNRSSYRYWCKPSKTVSPQRLKLIAELKRWFGLSGGSAGQRSLVT